MAGRALMSRTDAAFRRTLLRRQGQERAERPPARGGHLISSAEKFTMVGMKFSRMMTERICFQSVVLSPSSRQMDSSASFTAAGGLAMERTSTRCCFFIDFTAEGGGRGVEGWGRRWGVRRGPGHRHVDANVKRDNYSEDPSGFKNFCLKLWNSLESRCRSFKL